MMLKSDKNTGSVNTSRLMVSYVRHSLYCVIADADIVFTPK